MKIRAFVYFWVSMLLSLTVSAQSLTLKGSLTLEGSKLDNIQNGKLVYRVPGVGTFSISSQGGDLSYKMTGWLTRAYRLTIPKGMALWTWDAESANRKIKVTRLFLEGGTEGAGSTVRFEGTDGNWWLQPEFGFIYSSTYSGVLWDNKQMDVITAGIQVTKICIDYELVNYIPQKVVSDRQTSETGYYAYAEEIVLDRALVAGWNTLCLPFECQVSELGAGVKVQQFIAYEPKAGLDFALVDHLEANKPYMVYCPEDIPAGTIVFSSREVYGAVPKYVSYNGMTFTSNYEPGFSMYGKYGVVQNKLLKGGSNAVLNGTRAYFEYAEPASQAVLRINYQPMNSNTTGVEVISQQQTPVSGVYTLQGVRVRSDNDLNGLPAGIYIVNGRKVTVK